MQLICIAYFPSICNSIEVLTSRQIGRKAWWVLVPRWVENNVFVGSRGTVHVDNAQKGLDVLYMSVVKEAMTWISKGKRPELYVST